MQDDKTLGFMGGDRREQKEKVVSEMNKRQGILPPRVI
jgi:hypothetical protein